MRLPGQSSTVTELAAAFRLGRATGSPEPSSDVVTGATQDSRRVQRGDLYVAVPGRRAHGAQFAAQAVAAGAVAVLTDPAGVAHLADTVRAAVPVLVVDSPRVVIGPLSAALHGHPAEHLAVLGVTGTNGKTTTTYMVHHLLRCAGIPAGLIGTVAMRTLDQDVPSLLTTPEAPDLQRTLAEMRRDGVDTVALEVSSHALALHRVDGTRFSVVAFTNFSRDHLDFHGSMSEYFDAKLRLFTGGFAHDAVVCVDDEAGVRVAERARSAGLTVMTVASRRAPGVDTWIGPVTAATDGSQRFEVHGPFGPQGRHALVGVDLPMPGRYNTVNAVIALTAAHRLLLRRQGTGSTAESVAVPDIAALASYLAAFPGVPGRMQRIVDPAAEGGTPLVVVDYAHTPDALTTVLSALRPATRGRLVAVVGAGGERDAGKRAAMGAAAAAAADVVVVTDDNPRSEDPAAIRAAVLEGATAAGRRAGDVVEVADRAAAIARALATCSGPDDTVVVSGKGHELGQQYGDGPMMPFDDRVVSAEALHAWAVEAGLVRQPVGAGGLGVSG